MACGVALGTTVTVGRGVVVGCGVAEGTLTGVGMRVAVGVGTGVTVGRGVANLAGGTTVALGSRGGVVAVHDRLRITAGIIPRISTPVFNFIRRFLKWMVPPFSKWQQY